jgi:hypothetical protein
MSQGSPVATLVTLRRLLLGILLFGLTGTATELLLMDTRRRLAVDSPDRHWLGDVHQRRDDRDGPTSLTASTRFNGRWCC